MKISVLSTHPHFAGHSSEVSSSAKHSWSFTKQRCSFFLFFFLLILVCWRRFTSYPRVSSLETPSRNWKKSSSLRCSTWIYHNQDDWEASSTWHGSLQLVQRNLLKSRDPKLFWKDTILASERVPISMRMSRTWLYFKFWVIFSFKRIVHLWCFHPFTLHSWIPQN